jgi:uncharacterized protein (DUF433 family)
VSYSFPDVVALRAFVYLRSRDVPLQRVRKAVQSLRDMGATEHLSSCQFVAVDRDVVWKISDDVAVDLTRRPGQQVIAGTRVPYDVVASLLEDGVTAEEVAGFYPAVSATAARGALAFARYVDGRKLPTATVESAARVFAWVPHRRGRR